MQCVGCLLVCFLQGALPLWSKIGWQTVLNRVAIQLMSWQEAVFTRGSVAVLEEGFAQPVVIKLVVIPGIFFINLTVASTLPLLWGYVGDDI